MQPSAPKTVQCSADHVATLPSMARSRLTSTG